MSSAPLSRQHATLKSVLYRLQSTNAQQLSLVIPHLCRALADCKDIIRSEKQSAKDGPEAATLQKLKTLVGAFLIHETCEKRWFAVILIKTLVDIGSLAILHSCAPWIQGLFSVLKKPFPDSGKKAAVIVLTSIFNLTHTRPTLLREITTPALPQYITHSLRLALPSTSPRSLTLSAGLTVTILESYTNLLPRHPSIFRSFASQIRQGLLPFLAPTPSSTGTPCPAVPKRVSISAQRLFAVLPATAPKNGASEEWKHVVSLTIDATHLVADQIFRSTVEEWSSFTSYVVPSLTSDSLKEEPKQASPDPLHLPPWSGVNAGCERITGLLGMLESFAMSKTVSPVFVPLGRIFDLVSRLISTTVPAAANQRTNQRTRADISRDEQDSLFSSLPSIHVAVLELLEALCERLGRALLPFGAIMLDQIDWVFQHESFNAELRTQVYLLLARLLDDFGPALSKLDTKQLNRIIKACSEDLVPTTAVSAPTSTNPAPLGSILRGAEYDESSDAGHIPESVREAADSLLASYLLNIPARTIPVYIRTLVDRTVILNQNPESMLASVLNPGVSVSGEATPRPSILPFLARAHPHRREVEGVLRPRMPVVAVGSEAPAPPQSDEESDEDVEDQDGESGESSMRGFSANNAGNDQDNGEALSKAFATEADATKRKRGPDQDPPGRSSSPFKRAKNEAASSSLEAKAMDKDKDGRDAVTAAQTLVSAEPAVGKTSSGHDANSEHDTSNEPGRNGVGNAVEVQPSRPSPTGVGQASDSDSEGEFVVPELIFEGSDEDSEGSE